ncbi:MAG TPA: hypothetical protein VNT75_06520 [Symbiobacteriaceae bacterium]|nr:hypothetical protein [Symbiobacteriaceae bacterium]
MWIGLVLAAWGFWCLLRAPALAVRYRRAVPRSVWADTVCSPMEWRAMGVLWLLLGIGAFLYAH